MKTKGVTVTIKGLDRLVDEISQLGHQVRQLIAIESNRVELTQAWKWWQSLEPSKRDHILDEARLHTSYEAISQSDNSHEGI